MKNCRNQAAVLAMATHVPDHRVPTSELIAAFGNRLSPELIDTLLRLEVDSRYSIVEDFPGYLSGKVPRRLTTTTTGLAVEAVKKCLDRRRSFDKPIGLMMVATDTANRPLPCFGYELLAEFPAEIPPDINIVNMQNQGCSVLPKMFEMATYYLKSNPGQSVLIVASEGHTGFLDHRTEEYFHGLRELPGLPAEKAGAVEQLLESFLFGDGAVAILLGSAEDADHAAMPKVGPFTHLTNQEHDDLELLTMNQGGILFPNQTFPHYRMSKDVPRRGAFYAEQCVQRLLEKFSELLPSPDRAATFLIHTGSKKILDGVCKILGTDPQNERVQSCYKILREHANLSACSVGFILEDSLRGPREGTGLLVSFGVGFSGSAGLVDYSH